MFGLRKKNRAEGDVDIIVHEALFPGETADKVFVDVGAAKARFSVHQCAFSDAGMAGDFS